MESETTGAMSGEPSDGLSSEALPGLVLVYAPEADKVPGVVVLEPGSTVFGREPPPGGVKLALSSVSRVHARVERTATSCIVHDLRSRNGVLVRGSRVTSAELEPGDDVRIGDAIFVFVADHADAHQPDANTTRHPYAHAPIACEAATRRIFDALEPIAISNIPVLVLGETGTGKELVAEAIHRASGRTGTLRALNCAAIPANLVESELFGYKRGAFSGADRDKDGIVRAAHRGTLFLDEIGELSLDLQPKLLRLLEANEISPIGSPQVERVDVRFVCATHANLDELVEKKLFRADLYSRIRGYVVALPPLRERKQDLHVLVRALLTRLERPSAQMSVAFMVALARYDWPFNIRELFAVLRRAVALAPANEMLDVKHLPEELLKPRARASSPSHPAAGSESVDRPSIPTPEELRHALETSGGNVAELARLFRRDRSLIHRWLKQHAIDPADYRAT